MRFRYLLLTSVLASSLSAATVTKEYLSHVFAELTVAVDKTAEIPESVMSEFVMVTHDRSKRLANPGERYNSSDVVFANLAMRRLCFASRSRPPFAPDSLPSNRSSDSAYFLICYDRGGGPRTQCAVLFQSFNSFKSAFPVWAATIPDAYRCASIGDLRTAIDQENVVPYPLTFGVF
jgi:hypothetical protein